MVMCPICQSERTRKYFSNATLTLFYCRSCKVKFQHPMPTPEVLDQIYSSEYYDSYYPEKHLGEQRLLFQERLKLLENLRDGRKGKVLDMGSGRGVFAEAAKERGWDCLAQEFSGEAASALKKRLGIDVVVCNDLSEAKFPAESFDLVDLNHVLEHLYNPLDTVKEIYRILRPGGIFYCEVPRQNNFLNRLSNIFGKRDFGFSYKPAHLFIFDISSINFLLKQARFEIISMDIESIGDPHRYVRGVHYTSLYTNVIVKIVATIKLQIFLGGGNLVVISRKGRLSENKFC